MHKMYTKSDKVIEHRPCVVIFAYVYPYGVRCACIFIQLFVPLSCLALPLTWYTESSLACKCAFQLYDMEEYHSSSFAYNCIISQVKDT